MAIPARALAGLGLLLSLAACDAMGEGCAALRAVTGGEGRALPTGRAADPPGDLTGTDCSPGLARCVAGAVEVSLVARLPFPCDEARGGPEGRIGRCTCPWVATVRCPAGCVDEDVVVAAPADVAARQLCASDGPAAWSLGVADAGASCGEDGVLCQDGQVLRCDRAGQPGVVLAACRYGCAPAVTIEQHGESMISDGPSAILCRRGPAERR